MDIRSLYYFTEVAKDMHITHTANRLFISQQTLSNHIARLEEHCHTALLERKPKLALTYAGELVLSFANHVCMEHNNLLDTLSDIAMDKQGLILFGASTLRMSTCLPSILPAFSGQYPHVEIRITDTNSKELEQLILNGELDFAITITDIENPAITQKHLMFDQIYLCVADSLLHRYYGTAADDLKAKSSQGATIDDFAALPFCMLNNRMGEKIRACFEEYKIAPKTYTTSTYIQISNSIGSQGLAAYFATRTSLLNQAETLPENISVFPLLYQEQPLLQQIYIIQHKERYLTSYKQRFLALILEYFDRIEHLPIEQIINHCSDSHTELGTSI